MYVKDSAGLFNVEISYNLVALELNIELKGQPLHNKSVVMTEESFALAAEFGL